MPFLQASVLVLGDGIRHLFSAKWYYAVPGPIIFTLYPETFRSGIFWTVQGQYEEPASVTHSDELTLTAVALLMMSVRLPLALCSILWYHTLAPGKVKVSQRHPDSVLQKYSWVDCTVTKEPAHRVITLPFTEWFLRQFHQDPRAIPLEDCRGPERIRVTRPQAG